MKIIVEPLETTLTQTVNFTVRKRRKIRSVRPYIYMHNAPAGTFSLKVKSGTTVLETLTFTSAQIKSDLSTSDNFAHIDISLIPSTGLMLEFGSIDFELSATGYTFSESSYMGWAVPYESVYNDINGSVPEYALDLPFGIQFFTEVDALKI